jgi:uncharacterized protein YjbI with pentapeptide repeats
MKKKLIETPELPTENSCELPDGQFYEFESYQNLVISNSKLTGARGVSIEYAHFLKVQISDEQFPRLDLKNTRFDKCDLANMELERASFNRVELIGCRILGYQLVKSLVNNTLIKDCYGKFAQFEFTKFKATRFENCVLEDTNFQNADLSGVVFANCNLSNAMLSGAKLTGTDFRSSQIEGLQVNIEQLRGAIFEPLQAASLLQQHAGVILKYIEDS